jgi:hypothetical protein
MMRAHPDQANVQGKPRIRLTSFQGEQESRSGICDNCEEIVSPIWLYRHSNQGAVHLCDTCRYEVIERSVSKADAATVRKLYTPDKDRLQYMTKLDAWDEYITGGRKRIDYLLGRYQKQRELIESIKPANMSLKEAWKLAEKLAEEYGKDKYKECLLALKRREEAKTTAPVKDKQTSGKPYGEFSHDCSDHYEDGGAVFAGDWP